MGLRNGLSNKINGLTAFNEVINGNFSNGTTGWGCWMATISVSSNILSATCTGGANYGTASSPNSLLNWTSGKKIYSRIKAKVTNANCTSIVLNCNGSVDGGNYTAKSILTPINGTVYDMSGIVTQTAQTGKVKLSVVHSYADATTANGKILEVQQVMAIDLTTRYGVGNEPSLAQCDIIYANYFDGQLNQSQHSQLRR